MKLGRLPRPSGSIALLILICLAGGAAAGMAVVPADPPSALVTSDPNPTMLVVPESFDDSRRIELEIMLGPTQKLHSSTGGTITAMKCRIGGLVESGTFPLQVDGEELVALATTVPIWRDLRFGTRGPDVEALRRELARLGLKVARKGPFDRDLQSGIKKLFARAQQDPPSGGLPRERVIWLPAPSVRVASCDLAVGQSISPHLSFASLEPEVKAMRISSPPKDAVGGQRVIVVEGARISLEESGSITASDSIAKVTKTTAYRNYRDSDGKIPITGLHVLATPLTVAAVPASAIVSSAGKHCVETSDGLVSKVDIVASLLGKTLITLDRSPLAGKELVLRPDGDVPCE